MYKNAHLLAGMFGIQVLQRGFLRAVSCERRRTHAGARIPKQVWLWKGQYQVHEGWPWHQRRYQGGSSWTPEWLKFDNSYYKNAKEQHDSDLLVLETDDVLFRDDGFRWVRRPFSVK